jgi:hypothetical protein
VSIALVGTGTSAAQADSDPVENVAGLIEDVAPHQGEVLTGTLEATGHVVETNGVEIVAPSNTNEPITMTSTDPALPSAQVAVSLPLEANVETPEAAQDGTIVYPSTERDGVDVAVQLMDEGSTRIQTIIPNADAPTQYTYDIQIGDGGTVQILPDGGALFLDADGEFAGGAATPWAKDADANPVPTWYTTDGTNLVQHVDTSKATTFPVIADPWLGVWLISSVTVSWGTNGKTYVVTPTLLGRTATSAMYPTLMSDAVRKGLPSLQKYRDQLVCHPWSGIARVKGTWNIDAWRPDAGWTRTVAAGCNP